MNNDFIRQFNQLQQKVDNLKTPTQSHWQGVLSTYQNLPGLRMFYPFSGIDNNGNILDFSRNGLDLTRNGNAEIQILNNIIPFSNLDGTGDYYSRADEALLDISGADTGIAGAYQGMTMGGYFLTKATSSDAGLIGKGISAYQITHHTDSNLYFYINGGGTSVGLATTEAEWRFIVARYIPSSEMKIWQNKTVNIKTTGVPASITNTATSFNIGTASTNLNGSSALCFVCVTALDDATICGLYQISRGLLGI